MPSVLTTSLFLLLNAQPLVPATDLPINIAYRPDLNAVQKAAQQELFSIANSRRAATNQLKFLTEGSKSEILKTLTTSETNISVLDEAAAAKAGIVFGVASGNQNNSVIVQEFSMYRTYIDPSDDKKNYRIGVGIRLVININQKKGSIQTLSIPGVAAQAEASKLKANVQMQVVGIAGKSVATGLEMPVELNFTTLRQMYNGFDKIKAAIFIDSDADMAIEPLLLSEPVPKS